MKRTIKIFGFIMILCMLSTVVSFGTQATQNEKITFRGIGIMVNGSEISPCDVNGTGTEPFIRNADSSTYLPVRAVAGALGLDVDWNNDTNTVILKSNGTVKTGSKAPVKTNKTVNANLTYRDIKITLDGKNVTLKNAKGEAVEPFIKDGSTYIPVRAVATALGCEVGWDEAANMVILTKETGIVDPDPQQKVEEPLKITKQPVDVGSYGSSVKFTVSVTGGTSPYTYNWQYYEVKWYDVEGMPGIFTASGSTLKMLTKDGSKDIRCVVTDADGCTVTSDEASGYGLVNELSSDDFLMYVEDYSTVTSRGIVITGKVLNGSISVGDTINIGNSIRGVDIEGIEMYRKQIETAEKGDSIGILIGTPFGLTTDGKVNTANIARGNAVVNSDSKLKHQYRGIYGTVSLKTSAESGYSGVLSKGDKVQLYWGSDITAEFVSVDGLLIPGTSTLNVGVELISPQLFYVGQVLDIRSGGRVLGTYTIDEIRTSY